METYGDGLFYDASWIAVYLGQGMLPERHDARTALADPARVEAALGQLKGAIGETVGRMPGHLDYLRGEAARLAETA